MTQLWFSLFVTQRAARCVWPSLCAVARARGGRERHKNENK